MSKKNKTYVDHELRQEIVPHIKRLEELFGGRKGLQAFLNCHYHHLTKVAKGENVLKAKEARMIEYVTDGEVTFRQLRPDLFFIEEVLIVECEAGMKRYKEVMYQPANKAPMMSRGSLNG